LQVRAEIYAKRIAENLNVIRLGRVRAGSREILNLRFLVGGAGRRIRFLLRSGRDALGKRNEAAKQQY
jgi:hypothetical protein